MSRRTFLNRAILTTGLAWLNQVSRQAAAQTGDQGPVSPKDAIKVTKIETFVLKNSWVFVKISTDAGITGWGEMLKDDAKACAAGALEVSDYLVGKDPRPVVNHWQAIHRGSFYRGGPIKTAILSGIDQALWDITGKCYGVPVCKLLGGPTRFQARVYGTPDKETGVNAMKVGPWSARKAFKYTEGQVFVDEVVERFAALKAEHPGVDIGLDFHGAVQPTTATLLIKALEPHHPWFYEEVVQALNVDVMAELAKKTHIPLATGETNLHEVGLSGSARKASSDDPATRHLLCGWHHRTEDHRWNGRGLLRSLGTTQSKRSMLACREPPDCRVDSQFHGPRAR